MTQNILDKVIGYISPMAGARRAAARKQIDLLDGVRNYEAASQGRRLKNWRASAADANTLLAASLPTLRARSHDLSRNTSIGKAVVSKHADYIIGSGIMPEFKCDNPNVVTVLKEAFPGWSKRCDPEGRMDYFGQQHQACRIMVEAGEAFGRQRIRRSDDMLVPLQIQMLEPDLVDLSKSGQEGRNTIINGIEYDKIGRRRGYWVYDEHPGSSFARTRQSKRVQAEKVVHVFDPERTQNRGAPWMSSVMVEIRDLHEYNQAEIVRKKIESCNVGVAIRKGPQVKSNEDPLGLRDTDGAVFTDADGNPVERFEPGMWVYANNTDDVRFNTPAVSAGMEAYIRTCERRISAGVRMPYELLSGDYSQANFASGKLGILAYKRFVEDFQWHYFIPQWCEPTINWFIDACKLSGLIPADAVVTVDWHPPEFESINRLEDAKADLLEVRIGKRSPQDMISKTGRDPDAVLEEIVTWNAKVDANNVILDIDPRHVAINGQLQSEGDQSASDPGVGDKAPAKPKKEPANAKAPRKPAK